MKGVSVMYNPYDNSSNNNHNTNDDRTGKENSAGYGTAETPSYTTQASQNLSLIHI